MMIGGKYFDTENQVYLMGILNLTPDSFSDGGRYKSIDAALYRAQEMIAQGTDIIDIGGESTRPGHVQISVQEEIDRVTPVIAAIRARFDVPLSLDSYKSEVIAANLPQIDLINDIWGLRRDETMAALIAKSGLPCCLMHNRKARDYSNFWQDFLSDIHEILRIAERAGIPRESIILDGGVGFAKSQEDNLMVLRRSRELIALGYPLLVAVSRKSVIGQVLGNTIDKRLSGTLATTAFAVMQGASFVRVHDVAENKDVIRMISALREEV